MKPRWQKAFAASDVCFNTPSRQTSRRKERRQSSRKDSRRFETVSLGGRLTTLEGGDITRRPPATDCTEARFRHGSPQVCKEAHSSDGAAHGDQSVPHEPCPQLRQE